MGYFLLSQMEQLVLTNSPCCYCLKAPVQATIISFDFMYFKSDQNKSQPLLAGRWPHTCTFLLAILVIVHVYCRVYGGFKDRALQHQRHSCILNEQKYYKWTNVHTNRLTKKHRCYTSTQHNKMDGDMYSCKQVHLLRLGERIFFFCRFLHPYICNSLPLIH